MFPSLSCLLGKVGTRPGSRLISHHNSLTLLTTKHSQSPGPHSEHHNNLVSNICRRSHYSGSPSVSEFKQVQEELSKSPRFAREQEIVWSQAQPRPPNIRLISQHLRLMSPLHTSHSYVSILGTVPNT